MLNVKKFVNGAQSTAADTNKRGGKGALVLEADVQVMESGNNVFNVVFRDIGNYGRERWSANFGELAPEDIDTMIARLQELRGSGTTS
jgi:hypothetical protein|tara:strand:+ start:436 stop:699 length:264 start_codon:yes stop_codon:yes gene_type:complete